MEKRRHVSTTVKIEDLSAKVGELTSSVNTLNSTISDLSKSNSDTHRQILNKLDDLNREIGVNANEIKHCTEDAKENKAAIEGHIKDHPSAELPSSIARDRIATYASLVIEALLLIWLGIKERIGLPY